VGARGEKVWSVSEERGSERVLRGHCQKGPPPRLERSAGGQAQRGGLRSSLGLGEPAEEPNGGLAPAPPSLPRQRHEPHAS